MTKKKKIIILRTDITIRGGVERVTCNLANMFSTDHDVYIISIFKLYDDIFFDLNKNVKVIYLGYSRSDFGKTKSNELKFFQFFSLLWKLLLFYKELKSKLQKIIAEILPDTILGMDTSNIILGLLPRKHKYLKIATEHSSFDFWSKPIRFFKIMMYRRVDRMIVLNKYEEKNYGKYIKNISVIPNSLSFLPVESSTVENKRMIALGRMSEEKRFDVLIDVFSDFAKRDNEWKLYIFGEGAEKENLKKLVEEKKLSERVYIMDATQAVQKELLDSSIYLMTSRTEVFPMVLLEAMSCGVPCISFNIPGPDEIITDSRNGFLVDNNSKDQFLEKIERLTKGNEVRSVFGQNAKKDVQLYSEDKIYNLWLDIL